MHRDLFLNGQLPCNCTHSRRSHSSTPKLAFFRLLMVSTWVEERRSPMVKQRKSSRLSLSSAWPPERLAARCCVNQVLFRPSDRQPLDSTKHLSPAVRVSRIPRLYPKQVCRPKSPRAFDLPPPLCISLPCETMSGGLPCLVSLVKCSSSRLDHSLHLASHPAMPQASSVKATASCRLSKILTVNTLPWLTESISTSKARATCRRRSSLLSRQRIFLVTRPPLSSAQTPRLEHSISVRSRCNTPRMDRCQTLGFPLARRVLFRI